MNNEQLRTFGMERIGSKLNLVDSYYLELKEQLALAIENENEKEANEIWGKVHTYEIWFDFFKFFEKLKEERYYESWCLLDKIDIALSIVNDNFDISKLFMLDFLSEVVPKYMSLYPYNLFMSRESIVKKSKCSICNKDYSLRDRCKHIPGKVYCGVLCSRIVTDMEFLAVALVEKSVDKHAVVFFDEYEYDYSLLKELANALKSPFENFDININKQTHQ